MSSGGLDDLYRDMKKLMANADEAREIIVAEMGSRTVAEWRDRFKTLEGPWAVVQNALEVGNDPQLRANGYIAEVVDSNGKMQHLVANPVQFDETSPDLSHAPDHGQHTEEVLLELGLTWPEIAGYKESGAIL